MRPAERVFFRFALVVCAVLLLAHVIARAYVSATSDPAEVLTTFQGATELVGPTGALLGITVLVAAFVSLLRIGPAERALAGYNLKWVKPYLAIVAGSGLGAASAWITELGIWGSAVFGMIAGLAAVGLHQILTIHDGGLRR